MMKRYGMPLLLAALAFLMAVMPALAEMVELDVSGSTRSLRVADAPGGATVARLAAGTLAEKLDERNGWTLISSRGTVGWVDSNYVYPCEDEREALTFPYLAEVTPTADSKGKTVNLRSAPGGKVIAEVPYGTWVNTRVAGTTEEWTEVEYGDQRGCMMTKFLTFDEPDERDTFWDTYFETASHEELLVWDAIETAERLLMETYRLPDLMLIPEYEGMRYLRETDDLQAIPLVLTCYGQGYDAFPILSVDPAGGLCSLVLIQPSTGNVYQQRFMIYGKEFLPQGALLPLDPEEHAVFFDAY